MITARIRQRFSASAIKDQFGIGESIIIAATTDNFEASTTIDLSRSSDSINGVFPASKFSCLRQQKTTARLKETGNEREAHTCAGRFFTVRTSYGFESYVACCFWARNVLSREVLTFGKEQSKIWTLRLVFFKEDEIPSYFLMVRNEHSRSQSILSQMTSIKS